MTCNAFDSYARARQAGALALLMCLLAFVAPPARASAQDAASASPAPAPATTICGQPVAPPARLPPDGSGPVV